MQSEEERKEYQRQWRINNKEHLKQYRDDNREKLIKYEKERYIKNKPQKTIYDKEYRAKNKVKINEHQKKYNKANKEKIKTRTKKHYDMNKKRLRKYSAEYYAKHKETYRKYKLKKEFGITIDDYDAMLIKQNNCCSICHNKFKSNKDTHIDHNHTTMKVRGLLCGNCNRGIGYLRDDINILKEAIKYLKDND
jgi:hypothetical protein